MTKGSYAINTLKINCKQYSLVRINKKNQDSYAMNAKLILVKS